LSKNTQKQLLVWSEAKSLNNLSQKQKRAASGLKQNLLTISLAIGVELRICIERENAAAEEEISY
jgi:hypothetical protein